MLRLPNKDDPQCEYKSSHSVLFELNRTLVEDGLSSISVGTFHCWLKEYRPNVAICPQRTDYFDTCKEYQEEVARARQIVNKLKQSGSASEESIREHDKNMISFSTKLREHKESTQESLEYYRRLASECAFTYKQIVSLMGKEKLTPDEEVRLEGLTNNFSALLSADYMMGKNLPYWGESAQPGKTYYMMKLVCDVFGIVDHGLSQKFTYICDERAAGSKSTDHTITFIDYYVSVCIPSWVRKITLCLDNARICKNQYLVVWATELVKKGRFSSVRFIYTTVGHTKFDPDNCFQGLLILSI